MVLSEWLAGLSLLLKLTGVYFALVALRWMFAKSRPWPEAAPRNRFAVVIAARNEEAVIGRLVKSLLAQDYPRELFNVFVVPNNCTDDTAGAAFRAGAEILLCDHPVRQKGDALRQAFVQLEGRGYDAYVVFDADNVVDRNYLKRTNDAFCAGARVVKGRQMALNPKESWVAGCYDLYFALLDVVYNSPRASGGLSAKLVGTGFALHRSVLERLGGWNTQTIAEDAEFAAQCAAADIRVCWAPEAVTYDEEPNSFVLSLRQRKRWCSGVMQVAEGQLPTLLHGKGRLCRDMCLFLLTAALTPLSLLLGLLSRLLAPGMTDLTFAGMTAGLCWLVGAALTLILQRVTRPRERHNPLAALLFPLFMVSWTPLQVLALFHRTTVWEPVRHGEDRGNGHLPKKKTAAGDFPRGAVCGIIGARNP